MSAIDLLIRYAIASLAFQLACAWAYTFQSPWPLVDAFQLAPSAESQLFQSLGVRFDPATSGRCRKLLFLHREGLVRLIQLLTAGRRLHRVAAHVNAVNKAPKKMSSAVYLSCAPRHSFGEGGFFSS